MQLDLREHLEKGVGRKDEEESDEYVSQTIRDGLELLSNDVGGHSTAAMRPHGRGLRQLQVFIVEISATQTQGKSVDSDKDKFSESRSSCHHLSEPACQPFFSPALEARHLIVVVLTPPTHPPSCPTPPFPKLPAALDSPHTHYYQRRACTTKYLLRPQD